jgi:hypothetical protein
MKTDGLKLDEINGKLDAVIEDIRSTGGGRERGIHEQVHHLEERINDLNEKLDDIIKLIKDNA